MFEIGKKFYFEAAHQLVHHDGKCQRPHGHSYEFELIVEARELHFDGPEAGMVEDYSRLSEVGKKIVEMLDHRDINEVLDSDTTTAETLSQFVMEQASQRLPNLVEVRFRETANTFASFRPKRIKELMLLDIGTWVIEDIKSRLFDGVDTSDPKKCWEFVGAKDGDGYGYFKVVALRTLGTNRAHRVSAWLDGYDIENMNVMHTCDNPPCINPNHLLVGTTLENEQDKDRKGRRRIGQDHPGAKLTEEDVLVIRELCKDGKLTHRQIAEGYGVSTYLITAIKGRRVWKHVQ